MGLTLVLLLGSALAVVRVQFEGPDLARNLCAMMNERMRGRIEIRSIEWPMNALPKVVTGGWLPVTLHDVAVWDAEGERVIQTERITAELDLHALMFGRHDFVIRRLVVHGGQVLLREVTEPYPLHDYDSTVFSLIASFYGRRSAGFHAGVFAASSPLWDLQDFELRDLDLEVRTKPLDERGDGYLFRMAIADLSAKGFLFMDPSDPLVPKFYFSLRPRGGEGQVDLFYERGKDGAWKPQGEYSFPIQEVKVDYLAQLPGGWPSDPVANTLRFDATFLTKNGARARLDGSMIDYWDTPYGGMWDVNARVENAGALLRQSIDPDIGGDDVTLEAVVTGPIVFYPSIALKASGLTYKLSLLEPPLLLELDTLVGVYDLAVDEGAVDEFVARGAGGEVRLSAKWGGDGSDRSPFWVDSDIDIRRPIEMGPWLPPALTRGVGGQLDGTFHALRRKGDTKYGITVDQLDLRLGRLRVDRGQIYLDKSLDKVLLDGVRFTMPNFTGSLRCTIYTGGTTLRFDDDDCEADIDVGDVGALIRLFQTGGRRPATPKRAVRPTKAAVAPAPARPTAQPRRAARPLRRAARRLHQAQGSPAPVRASAGATAGATAAGAGPSASTSGKTTVKIGGTLDDPRLRSDLVLRGVPCLGTLRGTVRFEKDVLHLDSVTSSSLGGRLRVTGRVRTAPAVALQSVRVQATGVDLARTCALKDTLAGRVNADVTLSGPPDPMRLVYRGHACADKLGLMGETLGDVALWLNQRPGAKSACTNPAPPAVSPEAIDACLRTGEATSGRCAIVRATRQAGGELAGAVHADVRHALGGELTLSALPLRALVALAAGADAAADLPADALLDARALVVGGTLEAPTLTGALRLSRARVLDRHLGDGELRLRPTGAGQVSFRAGFLDGRLAVSGTVGTRAPYPLELTADVTQLELETLLDLEELGAPPGTRIWGTGRIVVKTDLGGPSPPAVTLDLAELVIVGEGDGPDGQPVPLMIEAAAPLQLTWDGATARLATPARLRTPMGEVVVEGSASPALLDLSARGALDLARAQPLLGGVFDRTAGQAQLRARISGSSVAPRVQVGLDLADVSLRLAGQDANLRVPSGRIDFSDGKLSLTGISVEVDDGYTRSALPLSVAGGVTFAGFTPRSWAVIVSGELAGEMLLAFAPEAFAQASGSASLSLTLTGTGRTPAIDGELTFGDGRQLRLLPRALRRELAFDRGTVAFTSAGTTGLDIAIDGVGGKIDDEGTFRDVGGSLELRDWKLVAADVVASADAVTFRVQRTLDLVLNLDAIQVVFDRGQLEIGGGVELTTGRYTANFDVGEALTPTASTAPAAPPLWETEPLLGAALLDLRVDVRRFSVVNNLGHIDLYGRVAITGTPRDLRFDDTIHVERGTFRIPGVRPRFARTSGRAEFSPRRRVGAQTPTLDIVSEADYRDPSGQDHLITLSISGDWPRLTWDLTTSSGLDKSQTLTLILSGRTPEELRRNLGDQAVAGDPTRIDPSTDNSQGVTDELVRQVASNLLESRVAEPLRELSNLDVARIELNLSSFAFHAEKRLLETSRAIGDFERTTRGLSANIRLEQRLPHHQLSPLFTWLRGELSTVAAETGFLVKRFDDADEPDVTSFEVKGVFRLLFGK
ncbi:MAG: hypothetical protein KJZ91_16440 [Myxococcales bacterium]|nr:hypothetical protein [Myxococcales bacterium]